MEWSKIYPASGPIIEKCRKEASIVMYTDPYAILGRLAGIPLQA